MSQPTLKNPPATVKPTPLSTAKKKTAQFIEILKTDHQYDIVSEIITHIKELKRAKKIKPLEKHRMVMQYNITLLSYCLPKMKVTEDSSKDSIGKGVTFNISIGGGEEHPNKPKSAGKGTVSKGARTGVSVKIPTTINDDGSITVKG